MGTQQLMLVVLSLFIVGIAVAVGINLFRDDAVSSNRDAIINDLNMLALRSQAYYRKPKLLGGGGNSFIGLTADAAGFAKISSKPSNANGTYKIKTAGTATQVVLEAVGNEIGTDGTSKVKAEAVVTVSDSIGVTIIN